MTPSSLPYVQPTIGFAPPRLVLRFHKDASFNSGIARCSLVPSFRLKPYGRIVTISLKKAGTIVNPRVPLGGRPSPQPLSQFWARGPFVVGPVLLDLLAVPVILWERQSVDPAVMLGLTAPQAALQSIRV
jgi:hypothetical protein